MPEPESNPGIMRQQVSDLLEDAARTSNPSRKRELTSRAYAFALAQNAEGAKRKARERQGAPSR